MAEIVILEAFDQARLDQLWNGVGPDGLGKFRSIAGGIEEKALQPDRRIAAERNREAWLGALIGIWCICVPWFQRSDSAWQNKGCNRLRGNLPTDGKRD